MKKELEHKLVSAHPLLYRDRYGDKRSTCMVWGFSCGDGWYDIIWNLSQKLEPMIQKFIDENPDLPCAACGCKEKEHYSSEVLDWNIKKYIKVKAGCNIIHHLPYNFKTPYSYPVPQWKRDFINSFKKFSDFRYFWKFTVLKWLKGRYKNKFYRPINRFLYWLYDKWNIGYDKPCHCNGFLKNHPAASQVKEKFGNMNFYMTSSTDEMYAEIRKAETLTETTCEDCGEPGTLRQDRWWRTVCDPCDKIRISKWE